MLKLTRRSVLWGLAAAPVLLRCGMAAQEWPITEPAGVWYGGVRLAYGSAELAVLSAILSNKQGA